MHRSWHRAGPDRAACRTDWLVYALRSVRPDASSHPSPAPREYRLLQPVRGALRCIPSPSSPASSYLLSRIGVPFRTTHPGCRGLGTIVAQFAAVETRFEKGRVKIGRAHV